MTIQTLPRQGWECPRCHKVNGPQVESCTCSPREESLGERMRRRERDAIRRLDHS